MSCVNRMNFGFSCKNPEYFVTSEWQSDFKPSVNYLIYRWIHATYFNFVLVLSFITAVDCQQLSFYAIYLTNWNVVLNAITSIFGAVLVTLYYRRKITFGDGENRSMTKTLKAYWFLSNLSTVLSISLSCVYWPLIYNGRDKGLNDSLTHAGNAIVYLVDVFIKAHPPRYGHFIHPLGFGIFYTFVFSVPYTLAGGTDRDFRNYIYSVIDWKKNTNGAITFALATIIFLTVMHFVLTFLASMRIYIHQKLQSRKAADQRSTSNENNQQFDNPSYNS